MKRLTERLCDIIPYGFIAVWMMAAMRMQEIAELMSKEDVKTLKMMLKIIKDGKNDEQTNH